MSPSSTDHALDKQLVADPGLPVPHPTQSFWQSAPRVDVGSFQSKSLPERRDVVVIGSGITGCSVSHSLLAADPSISLAVLDARGVCSGATGRNGGHIRCTAVQDYDRLLRQLGHDAAVKIVRFSVAHFNSIASALRELGDAVVDESEIRQVQTVSVILDEGRLQEMQGMLDRFNAAFPDLSGDWEICGAKDASQNFGVAGAAGVLVGKAGAAWPYRMVLGVFDALLKKHGWRFSVEQNTPVTSVAKTQPGQYPYIVTTPRGSIVAKHVVHCTEGHLGHLLPQLRGLVFPRRGQMTVQCPNRDYVGLDRQRSWSFYFDSGFDYLSQNLRTGDVFLGGGDIGRDQYLSQLGQPSDEHESIVAKAHLAGIVPAILHHHNPESKGPRGLEIKSSWTGIMCNTLDGLPLVGKLPPEALNDQGHDNAKLGFEWVCAGYGGYGMVNAWLCGRATAEMILGKDVSSWFPEPYLITSTRMGALNATWKRAQMSADGVKALV